MKPKITMNLLKAGFAKMSPESRRLSGLLSLLLLGSTGLHAETIYSDLADLSLKLNRTDGVTLGTNGPAEGNLNIGKSGSGAGFDRAAVVVFQLPDLGAIDDPFGTASLGVYLNQDTVTGEVNGDLYGLGRREFPEVQLDDYYGRSNEPDPSDATLVQDNFLTPTGLTVNSLVTTSVDGSLALTNYLNAQYEGGSGIGQYVFLRMNVDADTTQRWNVISTDGANGDLSQTPQINYILASAPVDTIRVESQDDGDGSTIPAQTLVAGDSLTTFAIAREAGGAFIDNVPVTWSISNASGIGPGDLLVAEDSKSATFTASSPGSAEISIFGNASNLIGTEVITVIAGPASQVTVETSPDGFGSPVGDAFLVKPASFTSFAVSRDSAGNFLGTVPATWSLEEITGGVVSGDLVASFDESDATFTAQELGSARIRASVDGLTSVDSGVITVAELVSLWDGGGGNSSWNSEANWFADILPEFGNAIDLVFHDPSITRLNLYLGGDKMARSLTYSADADRNFNIRLTQTGLTGAANFVFDTDSGTEPAELIVDEGADGNFKFGNISVGSENEYGNLVLADDLLITHNGLGTLTIDGNITELEGPQNITKAGTGTVILSGTNSYTGNTTVSEGLLSVKGSSLSDLGALVIAGGIVDLEGDEVVGNLFFDSMRKASGVYGSSASLAPVENQDDTRFSGSGTVTVAGVSTGDLVISEITFDGTNVTLTWNSNPGELFTVFFSEDLEDFEADVEDGVNAAPEGNLTNFTFPISNIGAGLEKAFFRVIRN